jgi:hypothetical protein
MTSALANFPVGLYGVRLAYQISALRISKSFPDSKSAFWDGFVCFLSNNVSRTLSFNCLSKFLLAKTRDEDSKDLQLGTFDSPQLFQPLNPTHSSSALLTSPYLKQLPPPFFATSLKK